MHSGEPVEIYFEVRGARKVSLEALHDCAYVIGTSTAFWMGEGYEQSQPADRRLIDNVAAVFREWENWQGAPKRFESRSVARDSDASVRPDSALNAIFFSGGVDSFFTLLDTQKSDLCTISIEHEQANSSKIDEAFNRLIELSDAAKASGSLSAIHIVTNMMMSHPRILDQWALKLHGSFLAACAHLVSDTIATASVSSTFTFGSLKAWGSHPLIDPLWSSSRLSVDHYGATHNRVQKTRAIAESNVARSSLSVCEYGRYSELNKLNCSRCVKCSRTMLTLDAIGKLPEQVPAFDWSEYSMDGVKKHFIRGPGEAKLLYEIIELADQNDRPDISSAIKTSINRSRPLMWITSVERFLRRKFPIVLKCKTALRGVRNRVINLFGYTPV
jgi:hypothetical protein